MQPKYVAAIIAGIVGGILLAGYAIIAFVMGLVSYNAWVPGADMLSNVCNCLTIPVILVLALVTGVLAVMRAKGLEKLADAAVVAALAGALAGLIYGVVAVIIAFLTPLLTISTSVGTSDLAGGLALGSLFGGLGGTATCCCAPIWLIVIAIVAAIGGVIYAALKLKLK